MENLITRIENLREDQTEDIYKIDCAMRGVEPCITCGSSVNMGYFIIVNSKKNREVEVPYLALHFLKHHSSVGYYKDLEAQIKELFELNVPTKITKQDQTRQVR